LVLFGLFFFGYYKRIKGNKKNNDDGNNTHQYRGDAQADIDEEVGNTNPSEQIDDSVFTQTFNYSQGLLLAQEKEIKQLRDEIRMLQSPRPLSSPKKSKLRTSGTPGSDKNLSSKSMSSSTLFQPSAQPQVQISDQNIMFIPPPISTLPILNTCNDLKTVKHWLQLAEEFRLSRGFGEFGSRIDQITREEIATKIGLSSQLSVRKASDEEIKSWLLECSAPLQAQTLQALTSWTHKSTKMTSTSFKTYSSRFKSLAEDTSGLSQKDLKALFLRNLGNYTVMKLQYADEARKDDVSLDAFIRLLACEIDKLESMSLATASLSADNQQNRQIGFTEDRQTPQSGRPTYSRPNQQFLNRRRIQQEANSGHFQLRSDSYAEDFSRHLQDSSRDQRNYTRDALLEDRREYPERMVAVTEDRRDSDRRDDDRRDSFQGRDEDRRDSFRGRDTNTSDRFVPAPKPYNDRSWPQRIGGNNNRRPQAPQRRNSTPNQRSANDRSSHYGPPPILAVPLQVNAVSRQSPLGALSGRPLAGNNNGHGGSPGRPRADNRRPALSY
jgi:hypothetical protein